MDRIDLGYGCYFVDGEIISTLPEDEESEIWMTWDEGWQWVIGSLEKIAGYYGEYYCQQINGYDCR